VCWDAVQRTRWADAPGDQAGESAHRLGVLGAQKKTCKSVQSVSCPAGSAAQDFGCGTPSTRRCGLLIELENPALIDDLLWFLRRCLCTVERAGPAGVLVVLPAGKNSEAIGCCYGCGRPVEESLERLGSVRCLDCRSGIVGELGEERRRELLDAVRHRQAAEEQIRAFVRVWCALHGGPSTRLPQAA